MQRLSRYIQGVRCYCHICKTFVTPYTVVLNDENGYTEGIEFECDNKHPLTKIAVFERIEPPGKD